MKTKKYILWAMLIISLAAIVIYAIPYGNSEKTNAVCLSILGGSLVSLFVALIEYLQERANVLRQFVIEAREVVLHFRKIKYFSLSRVDEILLKCIKEEENNEFRLAFQEPLSHTEKNKMIDYIETVKLHGNSDEANLEEIYQNQVTFEKERIIETMKSYISAATYDFKNMETTYEFISFIFFNKKNKSKIDKEIVRNLEKYQELIDSKKFIFEDAISRRRNFGSACDELIELNNTFFDVDSFRDDYNVTHNTVYQNCMDEILCSIEWVRTMISFVRRKEIPLYRQPVYKVHQVVQWEKDK